jgi:hypothetical protein
VRLRGTQRNVEKAKKFKIVKKLLGFKEFKIWFSTGAQN